MKDLINKFRKEYFKKYEVEYPVVWARDMAIMKRLSCLYTTDVLHQFICDYFDLDDEFIKKCGHPVMLFATSIPKIIAWQKKHQRAKDNIKPITDDLSLIEKARDTIKNDSGDFD